MMSLVNAVHTLIEVAAGRLNLTPDSADALHAAIDAEQAPAAAESPAPPDPSFASPSIPSTDPAGAPWPS